MGQGTLALYRPAGTALAATTLGPGESTLAPRLLPVTGIYTALVAAGSAGTLSLRLGAPDLVPTALAAPATPLGPSGNGTYPLTLAWSVANAGALPTHSGAAWWVDRLYLSADPQLDAADVVLGAWTRNVAVPAGERYTVSGKTATVPATTAAGTYHLILKTDAGTTPTAAGNLVEADETNNLWVASPPLTLLGRPDLVPTALAVPGPVAPNANGTYTLTLAWSIANVGAAVTAGAWADRLYLSADPALDSTDRLLGAWTRNLPVAPGGSYTVSGKTATLPATTAPGTYHLILKADGGATVTGAGALAEADESNNVRVASPALILLAPGGAALSAPAALAWRP